MPARAPIRTLVLSPFAGDYERNRAYALAAMRHSLSLDEAPFLSHLLYPQVLSDRDPIERGIGLRAEHAWLVAAEQLVAYVDLGVSPGMTLAIEAWHKLHLPEVKPMLSRKLGSPWSTDANVIAEGPFRGMTQDEANDLVRKGYT